MASSSNNKNSMPAANPMIAGSTLAKPSFPVISIDGISSDHTEAATMTPAAKPVSDFCNREGIFFFIRNTQAAPSMVPAQGKVNPTIRLFMMLLYLVTARAAYSDRCAKLNKSIQIHTIKTPFDSQQIPTFFHHTTAVSEKITIFAPTNQLLNN